MATISSPGVGSNLDVRTIVTQLVALEKQPLTQLQTKASGIQTKLSGYSQLKSAISGLQDAAAALLDDNNWGAKSFKSSDETKITGSATTSALATSFNVEVSQLAQTQSIRSAAFTGTAALGYSGRLDIQAGTWSGSSFTSSGASAVSVNVSSTDTLTDVATKINGANAGVTAVVVNSGTEQRLMLRGNNTGSASGFEIRAYDGSNALITNGSTDLGKFSHYNNGTSVVGMTLTQTAQNAQVTVDGIGISSSTNTIADAVPGVTFKIAQTTSAPVQVTVAPDTAATKAKIEAFQKAYNTVSSTIADLTKVVPKSNNSGPLQGDSTVLGIQSVLRAMVGANGPSGTTLSRLSDMGLELQRDGSLSLNSTKLTTALNDPTNLKTFFAADTGTSSSDGIARRVRDFAKMVTGLDGSIATKNKSLQSSLDKNGKEQERVNARISRYETQLYAQYARLDANMAGLNSLGSFVSSQVAQWNR